MTQTDDALKPCPFCGGEAEIWRAQQERTAWIACMGRCSVLVSKEYKTDAEAIAAWNTRADLATQPDPLADPRVAALVNLIRQAQGIIDPCYPAKHAAWQNATRATLAAFNTGGKDE